MLDRNHSRRLESLIVAALAAILLVGCQPDKKPAAGPTDQKADGGQPGAKTDEGPATPKTDAGNTVGDAKPAAGARPTLRIKAGVTEPYTDSDGNVWLADQGFDGGETIGRPEDMPIANTKDPALYRSERYSMNGYSLDLPNGKYTVKLHFAETYDGITGPGDRVFTFNVGGKEFKEFDVWVKSGGMQKAYIESVDVDVTDGKLKITFTPITQNPEINAIEIIPAP